MLTYEQSLMAHRQVSYVFRAIEYRKSCKLHSQLNSV
jgi:hypothetical protein